MGDMLQLIGDWGHVLAAGLFAALAIWMGRRIESGVQGKLLVAALSLTATWSLSVAFTGVHRLEISLVESLRNCAWATTLVALAWAGEPRARRAQPGLLAVYVVLVATLVLQTGVDLLDTLALPGLPLVQGASQPALILRMAWLIGALLLIQRICVAVNPQVRLRMVPLLTAMSAMWSYDLMLYGGAWIGADWVTPLFALRGAAIAALAPVIALAAHSRGPADIKPSRALATWGVGLMAALGVTALMLSGIAFVDLIPSPLLRICVTGAIFAMIVTALVVLPSPRFRSFVKVMVAKHFFAHRYDYRAHWLGFADTVGRTGEGRASIYERAIKAVADITESPAGLLLLAQPDGRLTVHSQWNWPGEAPIGRSIADPVADMVRHRFWVVDIDTVRGDAGEGALPDWIARDPAVWALVPIIHFDQLTGALLLARPRISRALDWEDFDMLRTAGRQVASYIAEAQGQQALDEARRFDEFNRRFAFIMHDIKNLVSQLSLLSRNAERHADNPEFRADMVLTLKESVGKMNDLLVRLSGQNSAVAGEQVLFALGDVARRVARAKGRAHPVLVEGDLAARAFADPARVEQIALHLVQNAIDASPPDAPVVLRVGVEDGAARFAVIDAGCGMSPEFIATQLFRPFASSKAGGFGIGAFEARELARAMDGTLQVKSRPGRGSSFILCLPLPTPRSTARDEDIGHATGNEEAA